MTGGVLCLKKEQGFTSHDAVAKVRKLFGTKKVGHTGTLDPQATGVLPILIGPAVKASDLIPGETKVYRAKVRFGISTDTQDVWGKTIEENDITPSEEDFAQAVASFVGDSMQIPPMVSAIKVDGKKLYEYAREGKVIERKARPITVFSAQMLAFSKEEAELRFEVSKGTYIRTLLWDLCQKVGCIGAMSALCREKSGVFHIENALTLSQVEEMSQDERYATLFPTENLFEIYPVFHLPAFFDRLIMNGCRVKVEKLGLSAKIGDRFRLYENGTFCALGEVVEEEGEKALLKIKNFPSES